ncbi:acetyltransferase [Prochlorococcus marinus]|uniref:acetyltransferase n=1 Tax=Prochlorococcus marinus TaxID=1219 RepID=UPI0007BB9A67|nr:acetyltransferase [Prochlorococcus marinus]KZR73704.1 UDP-N-acetylbacillosamine N-acetyltransferase [Prochlorococcus marinus str. MIT 1320]
MKSKLFIFGTGIVSQCISPYFQYFSDYDLCGYCVDDDYFSDDRFMGRPVIPLSQVISYYPPSSYSVFVALGYHQLNLLRSKKVEYFDSLSYQFASFFQKNDYISCHVGMNCFVMPGAVLQPYVTIHDDVFVWSGALIGHHTIINSHSWITGGCSIGGLCTVGEHTFVGLNATVGERVRIGENSLLGASTITTKCIDPHSVVVLPDTPLHRLNSSNFQRLSSAF